MLREKLLSSNFKTLRSETTHVLLLLHYIYIYRMRHVYLHRESWRSARRCLRVPWLERTVTSWPGRRRWAEPAEMSEMTYSLRTPQLEEKNTQKRKQGGSQMASGQNGERQGTKSVRRPNKQRLCSSRLVYLFQGNTEEITGSSQTKLQPFILPAQTAIIREKQSKGVRQNNVFSYKTDKC